MTERVYVGNAKDRQAREGSCASLAASLAVAVLAAVTVPGSVSGNARHRDPLRPSRSFATFAFP